MKYRADIDGLRALAVDSGAVLSRRRSRLWRRLRRSRYLLCHFRISDLRHDRCRHPPRLVLDREFLQAPGVTDPAGAVRRVPGNDFPRLRLLPARRTRRNIRQAFRQRGRFGFKRLFRDHCGLFRCAGRNQAAAAYLVAGCRGAILSDGAAVDDVCYRVFPKRTKALFAVTAVLSLRRPLSSATAIRTSCFT